MNIDYIAIGKRIRAIRISKNMPQEKLAEKAELSTTHMSHVETGNTKASLGTIAGIANALEVSVDELLCDNVVRSKHVFEKELANLLADCTDIETYAIVEIAKTAKNALNKVISSIKK
ncbi:MAG: helix-turn-helix domain-containing protein [Oscillospiraceae bacterium]|nr:helix-turn-helix domain-containing protein [Oscillospiraceae bacterium]